MAQDVENPNDDTLVYYENINAKDAQNIRDRTYFKIVDNILKEVVLAADNGFSYIYYKVDFRLVDKIMSVLSQKSFRTGRMSLSLRKL